MRKALILLIPLFLAGCGYESGGASDSAYHWSSLYRQDVKTIAVPIFTTSDFTRGVEFNLTKAVINQIEAKTPYKVVPRERADTILEGEVLRIDINTVSQDFNASIPQEQILNIIINFTWKDLRTGKILAERRNYQAAATYYATLGEARFVGQQLATERLATALVEELQADW